MVHAHHAEEVDVKLADGVGGVGEFDRAGDAEARVVDDDVDVILLSEDKIDRGAERIFLRDVGLNVDGAVGAGLAAGQLIDAVARVVHGPHRGEADAGRAAGDDADFAHRSYLPSTSAMMSTASSISACVCVAIRLVRSRHSCGAAAGGSEELT